ncbi:hypothetical protein TNCV_5033191 [Trichonephila clavipes]|nr:hypothetical protein TNCV_5033191 [Trichonephila clavipes]
MTRNARWRSPDSKRTEPPNIFSLPLKFYAILQVTVYAIPDKITGGSEIYIGFSVSPLDATKDYFRCPEPFVPGLCSGYNLPDFDINIVSPKGDSSTLKKATVMPVSRELKDSCLPMESCGRNFEKGNCNDVNIGIMHTQEEVLTARGEGEFP